MKWTWTWGLSITNSLSVMCMSSLYLYEKVAIINLPEAPVQIISSRTTGIRLLYHSTLSPRVLKKNKETIRRLWRTNKDTNRRPDLHLQPEVNYLPLFQEWRFPLKTKVSDGSLQGKSTFLKQGTQFTLVGGGLQTSGGGRRPNNGEYLWWILYRSIYSTNSYRMLLYND